MNATFETAMFLYPEKPLPGWILTNSVIQSNSAAAVLSGKLCLSTVLVSDNGAQAPLSLSLLGKPYKTAPCTLFLG